MFCKFEARLLRLYLGFIVWRLMLIPIQKQTYEIVIDLTLKVKVLPSPILFIAVKVTLINGLKQSEIRPIIYRFDMSFTLRDRVKATTTNTAEVNGRAFGVSQAIKHVTGVVIRNQDDGKCAVAYLSFPFGRFC